MAVVSAVPRTGLGSREGCQEAGGLGDAGAGDTRSDLAPLPSTSQVLDVPV